MICLVKSLLKLLKQPARFIYKVGKKSIMSFFRFFGKKAMEKAKKKEEPLLLPRCSVCNKLIGVGERAWRFWPAGKATDEYICSDCMKEDVSLGPLVKSLDRRLNKGE